MLGFGKFGQSTRREDNDRIVRLVSCPSRRLPVSQKTFACQSFAHHVEDVCSSVVCPSRRLPVQTYSTIIGAKLQRLPELFRERTFHGRYTDVDLGKVNKRKSESQDGGFENSVTQLSAFIHDNNKISTVIPMSSGLCNRTRLLRKQPDVCISGESKIVDSNRKQKCHKVYISFYSRQQQNSNGFTHVFVFYMQEFSNFLIIF